MSKNQKPQNYLLVKVVEKNGQPVCESVLPVVKIDGSFVNSFGDKIKMRKSYRKEVDIMNVPTGDYHLIPATGFPGLPADFFKAFEIEAA